MQTLSKSRYTAFRQCPKNLWLKIYKPKEAVEDPSLQARLDQGNEVGDLAMQYFRNFVEVTTTSRGKLDLAAMIKKTQQCMKDGVENICEASFDYKGNYCAVDILHKEGRGWAIYEVKSTSAEPGKLDKSKIAPYLPDIAYQTWVLEQCGVKVTGSYLLCLNSNYRRGKTLDLKDLFLALDLSQAIAEEYQLVDGTVKQAQKVINSKTEPSFDLSENCKKPYKCAFWDYCTRHLPTPSVFDVYSGAVGCRKDDCFHFDQKLEFYRAGRVSFEDLLAQPLGHIQRMQVAYTLINTSPEEYTWDDTKYIDKRGIRKFLVQLSLPLYFLDFETMQSAVPQFEGTKPYQQIPFQYSLHIVKRLDKYKHKEYLAKSNGKDPRRGLAEQLCKDIPTDVCVMAYNMSFEKTVIKELAAAFPDLSKHLLRIHDNIVDLIVPFRKGFYYVHTMGGSFSIKSVLPALFPNDPELDYHNLSGVHNGSEAMDIFPKIKEMSFFKARRTRKNLLRYCKLDTWAMVKIWEKLVEVAEYKKIGEYHKNI